MTYFQDRVARTLPFEMLPVAHCSNARNPRPTVPVRVAGPIVATLVGQTTIATVVQVAETPRTTSASGVRAIESGTVSRH